MIGIANLLITHQHELVQVERALRNKLPRPCRVNATWALEFTFYTDGTGKTYPILGMIDHGSRLATCLKVIINRRAWTVLGHLCLAIGRYGKPSALRSDNEPLFDSFVFKTFLKLAGVHHQQSEVCAPWQNGRIERLFGTLKPLLRQLVIPCGLALRDALLEFTLFYNHVRPHQGLGGLTPEDAWQGRTWRSTYPEAEPVLVSALDGLLVGYHLRR